MVYSCIRHAPHCVGHHPERGIRPSPRHHGMGRATRTRKSQLSPSPDRRGQRRCPPQKPLAPKSTALSEVGQFIWAQLYAVVNKLSAQYHHIAFRRGKKRAAVALGHTLLISIYHMIAEQKVYEELGGDYLDQLYSFRKEMMCYTRGRGTGHKRGSHAHQLSQSDSGK
jgi:hypothetical protein